MIRIRSCAGLDEMEACVKLQIETWGYDETDIMPRKAFLLAQKIGGQVIGAFESRDQETGGAREQESKEQGSAEESETLVGFALSLPGVKSTGNGPKSYLHSHMLAVCPAYRNRGLGAQLKWEQRREALSRGIGRMEWTFDPLEIKNAFLNIHRLGAIAREYRANFYGVSSSRLQGGLPTDRLLAEWELDFPRVEALHARRPAVGRRIEERILVPASIEQWKAGDKTRDRARAFQLVLQQRLQRAFSLGLAVVEFSLDRDGNGIYELGPYSHP